jgi:hypothetical protein
MMLLMANAFEYNCDSYRRHLDRINIPFISHSNLNTPPNSRLFLFLHSLLTLRVPSVIMLDPMSPNLDSTPIEEAKTKTDIMHVEDTSKAGIQMLSLDSIEQTKAGYYIWLVSIAVGVGGFLFGKSTHTFPEIIQIN